MASILQFASSSMTGMPTVTEVPAIVTSVIQQTVTAVPTVAGAPIVGGDNNTGSVPASATVMIVVGVVLGLVGVAGVITLIWWMRRRHLARFRTNSYPTQTLYPPAPPPKAGGSNKALPNINVASANAYRSAPPPPQKGRSNTIDSINKDKALPTKPADSILSPSDRPNKSPALASMHEMRSQQPSRKLYDEESGMNRTRSYSIDKEPTAPTNFI